MRVTFLAASLTILTFSASVAATYECPGINEVVQRYETYPIAWQAPEGWIIFVRKGTPKTNELVFNAYIFKSEGKTNIMCQYASGISELRIQKPLVNYKLTGSNWDQKSENCPRTTSMLPINALSTCAWE